MILKKYKISVNLACLLLLAVFSSCMDETLVNNNTKGTFLSISGIGLQSSTHPGTPEDYFVSTLRILAFDKVTNLCVSNVKYSESQWTNNEVQHPISPGTYNFVFLANEPIESYISSALDAISVYEDLDDMAYPADAFASNRNIPMMQEIKNVKVLSKGAGVEVNGGSVVSELELKLNRQGIRVDVLLKADGDFEDEFKGVTFSNIPDKVALTSNYTGSIGRGVIRKFVKADNASYFSDTTIAGVTWGKKISRIILPASEPVSSTDKSEAVVFTLNMETKYSPSSELAISPEPAVNYSLPKNTKLDFTGTIKDMLLVNIVASEWNNNWTGWEIPGNRVLNVSNSRVSITDFNGARISFKSNMPYVLVDETVVDQSTGNNLQTSEVFNVLSYRSDDNNLNKNERFSYDPATGDGYMDILLDQPNVVGTKTYTLTLIGTDNYWDKTNLIKKTIDVTVSQYGERFAFGAKNDESWYDPYVGAFFRNEEKGERVITGNRWGVSDAWTARVVEGSDFILLSTTPSFDPNIGTDNPGDPEKYPVTLNQYQGELGGAVKGRGRVYFRIGLTETRAKGTAPRYGVVEVTYAHGSKSFTTPIYVRQGEEPDYLMRGGGLSGSSGYGAKFSPYNLTVAAFKNNPNTTSTFSSVNKTNLATEVDFVKYPTQAGAHFQWGLPIANEVIGRRAYHPTNKNMGNSLPWSISGWPGNQYFIQETSFSFWRPSSGVKYENYYEICPPGYFRPTDGPLDQRAVNSTDDQVYMSDWRMSLFQSPMKGDASWNTVNQPFEQANKPVLYNPVPLEEILYGYYADGFFDRRPVMERDMVIGTSRDPNTGSVPQGATKKYKGVSLDNADAAYRGVLIFNKNTNASLFLPAAGRRWYMDGSLEYAGETGYYWSSSVAPGWADTSGGVQNGNPYGNMWNFEFNFEATKPISTSHLFGNTIRCVKK
nr:hypothetical protein [Parabacteroides goldsteinii]